MIGRLVEALLAGTIGIVAAPETPNVVVILADDMGWADVGAYGAEGFETPHLDGLAAEGMRFTDFYVAAPFCSPSRAALLTGCYPQRVGIRRALQRRSEIGLHPDEVTIADLLRGRGYATAVIGKWHLGRPMEPAFAPAHHGFDEVFCPPVEPPTAADDGSPSTTVLFTERAVDFIDRRADRPFFLYLAPWMPHTPLEVSERFAGKSERGVYGDVIMEIDWAVGRVLEALKSHGIDEHTFVIFTSDNGPWLAYGDHAGSAGPLREGKATSWEGGVRVPCLVRWPDGIPAGSVCTEPVMTIDLLPTLAKLVGARLPDHPIDGRDIGPLLRGEPGARSPHELLCFYHDRSLQAVRSGRWKLHFPHPYKSLAGKPGGTGGQAAPVVELHTGLALYDLGTDPGETIDVHERYPEVVERLTLLAEEPRRALGDDLTGWPGAEIRPPLVVPRK